MSQPSSGSEVTQLLDMHDLQYLFNTRILKQVLCGPLVAEYRLNKVMSDTQLQRLNNLPPGTKRQYVKYWHPDGTFVCSVYQYRLPEPDDILGASGLPDPKIVVYDGVTYGLKKAP
jgi:hypothetical protein